MAVQLVLRRPVSAPASQLRVVWQGHREGDHTEARWSGPAGTQRWPGAAGVRWIQRDALRQGEEWKLNLPGVPADVHRIVLQLTTTTARTVGVAVLPLTGDRNDAALHPGAELAAGQSTDLLELSRSANGWLVTAVNTAVPETDPPQVVADRPVPGWPGPVTDRPPSAEPPPVSRTQDDQGPQVQIPSRLEPFVDAARASGNTKRRTVVGAVVDVSASMRPWIVSGQLADVLTAVQAIAGVSNRPSVATRFLPGTGDVELALSVEPAAVVAAHIASTGLQTGNRSALLTAVGTAAQRGGLNVLVTDDASAADGVRPAVVVLLGPDSDAFAAADGRTTRNVVAVPPGPVDIRRLARVLADATAD